MLVLRSLGQQRSEPTSDIADGAGLFAKDVAQSDHGLLKARRRILRRGLLRDNLGLLGRSRWGGRSGGRRRHMRDGRERLGTPGPYSDYHERDRGRERSKDNQASNACAR